MKALDVDMATFSACSRSHNPIAAQEIETYRNRHQELEKNYDQFLASLHVYSPKMSEQQRLVCAWHAFLASANWICHAVSPTRSTSYIKEMAKLR